MDPRSIDINDFDYPLPDERIASHPLEQRDRCRLLVSRPGCEPDDRIFAELPELLPPDALLVYNDTRVINARIKMRKPTGAVIEIFLLEPIEPADYERAFAATRRGSWAALVGNLKKWRGAAPLTKECVAPDGTRFTLRATLGEPLPGGEYRVDLDWYGTADSADADKASRLPFATVVEAAGYIPIPPYLNRDSEASDANDYQTVYSRVEGSVAAPTAGLHFTPELLEAIDRRGITRVPLTLHVGAGTFRPVKCDHIGDHPMHTEAFTVSRRSLVALRDALRSGRPIVAVGTTSVRTLESLPRLAQFVGQTDGAPLHLPQWTAYESADAPADKSLTAADLQQLIDYIDRLGLPALTASTAIMIAPGFKWRVVSGMVTNFHQPRSTLLLLVSSFLRQRGDDMSADWRRIYDHALSGDYRFLSYGDACLFL